MSVNDGMLSLYITPNNSSSTYLLLCEHLDGVPNHVDPAGIRGVHLQYGVLVRKRKTRREP